MERGKQKSRRPILSETKKKIDPEESKQKHTLAPMGKIEQIRNAHKVMQQNFKKEGRVTMKQQERYKWRKKLQKKVGYKSDNDLW
tara:strand:- start:6604 stop:6858 length:255 start_codon:yes stop_codon:yes gene_type:complete